MSSQYAIETTGLTKIFGTLTAVDKLSLKVPTGSIFGLLGPNGAGKTTTFSMICGFVKPSAGEASVLGFPLKQFPHASGKLAALPQDARFHPERTVIDCMVYLGTLAGLTDMEARAQAKQLLIDVDLLDAMNMKGGHLSHGMAKRFGIAQAFLGHPKLVLLDEPTAGLDPKNAHTVRQMIRVLSGSATVVVSSHNLAEVQDLCTYAGIINAGKLVSSGSMDELTARNQQVVVTVTKADAALISKIEAMNRVIGVVVAGSGNDLKIMFKANADESIDQAVSQIIAGIIAAGGAVGGVRRGQDLEERYLEVT
jgi:ABC-type multidrug transport system ATPase subunit